MKNRNCTNVISQYSGLTTHYKYDEKSHLIEASTRTCHEDYMYNALGQRTYMLHTRKGIFRYAYDAEGKLAHVNDTRYFYDELGRLAKVDVPNSQPKYYTHERVQIGDLSVDRLVRFQDSTGKVYTYSYTPENPLPVAVYCDDSFWSAMSGKKVIFPGSWVFRACCLAQQYLRVGNLGIWLKTKLTCQTPSSSPVRLWPSSATGI